MDNNTKKTSRIGFASALLVIMFLLVGGVAVVKNNEAETLRRQMNDGYSRSFLQLVDSVNDLNTALLKGAVTNSTPLMSDISNEIYRQATFAQANLGELPISHVELDNTARFLSQVGDYTYSLSQKVLNGGEISDKEKQEMANLSKYASQLSETLYGLQDQLFSGSLTFEQITNDRDGQKVLAAGKEATDIGAAVEEIEKDFQEYPSLIYDGPFSDHINKMEARHIKGAKEISTADAEKKIRDFTGDSKLTQLSHCGDSDGTIKTYCYTAVDKNGNNINIEVSKMGGHVLFMLKNRDVKERNLDIQKAIQIGSEFLVRNEIESMKESYWEIQNNTATINYAYVENGITMYPDLIKMKIALDDGEVLGFESQGYLMAHEANRKTNPANITLEEARQKVNPSLNIQSEGMAVIPLDGGTEVLCYEFKGKFNDRTFIVYINATTGNEEKILMLIEGEEGTLTL